MQSMLPGMGWRVIIEVRRLGWGRRLSGLSGAFLGQGGQGHEAARGPELQAAQFHGHLNAKLVASLC